MFYQHDRQLAFGKSGSAALLFSTVARMHERRNLWKEIFISAHRFDETHHRKKMDKVDDVAILLPILVDN